MHGHSAVRMHIYVCEGRADNADVVVIALDIHEPAFTKLASGLHTTRRSGVHQRYPAVPLCDVSAAHRGGSPIGYFAYSRHTP